MKKDELRFTRGEIAALLEAAIAGMRDSQDLPALESAMRKLNKEADKLT